MGQARYEKSVFNRWTWVYAVVCFLEIFAEILLEFDNEFGYQLRLLTKPLVMPVLAMGFYKSLVPNFQSADWSLLAGLLLSWAGDVLLMPPFRIFALGLFAFLMAHIAYSHAFFKSMPKISWNSLHFLPGVILFLIAVYTIVPHVIDIKIPVISYVLVISIMFSMALVHHLNYSFLSGLLGAFFFVVSDYILAWALFVNSFAWSRLFVMGFYLLAQWLIVRGVLTTKYSN
ncbi:MAG: lysoplasmalogenase [Bacteroidia bacterium]|nr:lysoplasmalogenase [Bacteroidia bacterium]